MAGSTRSDVLSKQPFNFHFGDILHSNTGATTLPQHGKFSSPNERDCFGFGSKFIHNYDTWNSFGAKYIENNNMTCLKNELEESVANGDHGLRFVNGFAAQMRHNKVAADSSDESDDNNLSTYEIDSNVESTPSLCSMKTCQRSVSSVESCSGSDLSDTESRKSHASAISATSIPRSGSLRMSSNDTALAHANPQLQQTNMACAGSTSVICAVDAVYKDCIKSPDSQHVDVNGNRIENGANHSLVDTFLALSSKGGVDPDHPGSTGTFVEKQGDLNTSSKPNNECHTNVGTVQGWLDKQEAVHVQCRSEENTIKQIGLSNGIVNGCNCCKEQEINHLRHKKSRKVKKKRKREYEVELLCNDVKDKRTLLNGHSKNLTKDQFQRWKNTRQERHRKTVRRVNAGTKGKIRRKLSLQRISESDAKKMIKELKKTLKRVSAEIEELQKLTRKSKKKKLKKVSKKSPKSPSRVSNSTLTSLVENHRMERRSNQTSRPPDPYRFVPKQRFTFHGVLPSPPSLVVRNGDLEPTFSMAIARGFVPPKKHPIWSWKLGNPPLPGTRTTSSKNNGTH